MHHRMLHSEGRLQCTTGCSTLRVGYHAPQNAPLLGQEDRLPCTTECSTLRTGGQVTVHRWMLWEEVMLFLQLNLYFEHVFYFSLFIFVSFSMSSVICRVILQIHDILFMFYSFFVFSFFIGMILKNKWTQYHMYIIVIYNSLFLRQFLLHIDYVVHTPVDFVY